MKAFENAVWIASQISQRSRLLRGPLAVLMYHRVSEAHEHAWMERAGVPRVSPAVFADQMAFLAERRFRVLDLEEVLERLERREPFEPRSVAITFDDGYRDNLERALPVLEQHSFPATLFVATDVLQGKSLLFEHLVFLAADILGWEKVREHAVDRSFRSAKQLVDHFPLGRRRELANALRRHLRDQGLDETILARELYLAPEDLPRLEMGGIRIGSHGAAHHPHSVHTEASLRDDLKSAEDVLARFARRPSSVYGSPYGSHRPKDVSLLRELGFRGAVSVKFGTNRSSASPFFLRRISLGDRSWHRLRFLDRRASLAARLDRWLP